ncbi:MAG: tyrosine-protein phosphatase [Erythrobacter sp.]|jgi:protein tyrosine/serine phosphatase|nr:tyrosine-protein phosphatase [Erythrobacter sp.]
MIREPSDTPASDPFLPTEGIHNLRDYGGWAVPGGARVKRGLLYRSGQHFEASDADLESLQRLGIATIIDLRGLSERTKFPCRRHADFAARVIAHEGETSSSPPHEGGGGGVTMTADLAYQRMISVYTRMPANPAMITMFTRYFEALDPGASGEVGGSLVHCFAGKDRTGIAASLLLHVLGVARDDIVAEYLRTNDAPTKHVLERQSLPRMRQVYAGFEDAALANLIDVRPEYIETYFTTVEDAHGSIDAYLEDRLGVDEQRKARLREALVG